MGWTRVSPPAGIGDDIVVGDEGEAVRALANVAFEPSHFLALEFSCIAVAEVGDGSGFGVYFVCGEGG